MISMGELKIIDLYYDDHKTNKTSFLNNTRSSLNISTDIKKVETETLLIFGIV